MKRHYPVLILLAVILIGLGIPSVAAQSSTIELTGTVDAVQDGSITVNGLTIDLGSIDPGLSVQLVSGVTIHIAGNLQDGTVIAIAIEILSTPEPAADTSIKLKKSVSTDNGATWQSADVTPGPQVEPGSPVLFRLQITNDGQTDLTNLQLTDSGYDLSTCTLPDTLGPEDSGECVIGPFDAQTGQQINTATVSAQHEDITVSDTDTAHYFGGELDDSSNLPVTIVIEGPVQQINVNIITIYNINVEVASDDPILPVIQIGDEIRVEGNAAHQGDTIIIVAVSITIINVDIVINDDHTAIWRDSGNCSNPPPPWAPANGWRRRCESSNSQGDNSRSKNKNKDDDD